MRQRQFIQCDVFSPYPTQGNALAVVVDGKDLTEEQMQRFAAWTNLAETTFLLPPDNNRADYRVRIFTPSREMPFAGHPTLGSCMSWLYCGGKPKSESTVIQQCHIGMVEIDISNPQAPAFLAPPTSHEPMSKAAEDSVTDTLQIPRNKILNTTVLNNGPIWQVFELDCAETVLQIDSSLVKWPIFKSIGLIGAHPPGAECDYEVRMLAPSSGMSEDPITGSLNAALARWLISNNRLKKPITMAQGTNINRHGRVSIRPDSTGESAFIGGQVHILIDGTVSL